MTAVVISLLLVYVAFATTDEFGLKPGEFQHLTDEVFRNSGSSKEVTLMRVLWPKFVNLFPESIRVPGLECKLTLDKIEYGCQTESVIHPKFGTNMEMGPVKRSSDKTSNVLEVYADLLLNDESKQMDVKLVTKKKGTSAASQTVQARYTFLGENKLKLTFAVNDIPQDKSDFTSSQCLVTLQSVKVTKLTFPHVQSSDLETLEELGERWVQAGSFLSQLQEAIGVGLTEAVVEKAKRMGQQSWLCIHSDMFTEDHGNFHNSFVYSERFKTFCGKFK